MNDAGPAARRELASLYRTAWEQFAAAAERADEAAVEQLAALEQPYRAAHAAWQRASAMWEEPMREHGADGPGRSIPPWPLPHPDEAFTEARRARPGTYVDVRDEQVIELAGSGEVEASRERLTPDGFVRMRAV